MSKKLRGVASIPGSWNQTGLWRRMTLRLVHSHRLADWFAYPSSWPSPNVLRSFVRRTKVPSAQLPSLILLVSLSVLTTPSRPQAERGTHTCVISGSFPLMSTNKHNKLVPLPLSIPPDLWIFMCFTRVRASPCATFVASIRCVVF